jgi:hypothetical protein
MAKMAAGSGSGCSKRSPVAGGQPKGEQESARETSIRSGFERPVLVVRERTGGGFIVETYETHGGMLMATVMSADSADHASRIARAALQDIEREADVRAAEGRGIAQSAPSVAGVKERV